MQALIRKFALAPDVELGAVAAACPGALSGADMYALCADAWMVALKRTIQSLEESGSTQHTGGSSTVSKDQDTAASAPTAVGTAGLARVEAVDSSGGASSTAIRGVKGTATAGSGAGSGGSDTVVVCQSDMLQALSNLTPSLSKAELAKYEALRDHYESQRVR